MSISIALFDGSTLDVSKDGRFAEVWVSETGDDDDADLVCTMTCYQAEEVCERLMAAFGTRVEFHPLMIEWTCTYVGMDGLDHEETYTTPAKELEARQAAVRTFLEERGAQSISISTDEED